jgi:hypothetical protein
MIVASEDGRRVEGDVEQSKGQRKDGGGIGISPRNSDSEIANFKNTTTANFNNTTACGTGTLASPCKTKTRIFLRYHFKTFYIINIII